MKTITINQCVGEVCKASDFISIEISPEVLGYIKMGAIVIAILVILKGVLSK